MPGGGTVDDHKRSHSYVFCPWGTAEGTAVDCVFADLVNSAAALVGHWQLDEEPGTGAAESSGRSTAAKSPAPFYTHRRRTTRWPALAAQ